MTEINDRRLPLALIKNTLLSAAATSTVAEFRGVEHRVPYFIRTEPVHPTFPRGCLCDEQVLIALLCPIVAKENVLGPLHHPIEVSPAELIRQVGETSGDDRARATRSLKRLGNTLVTTDYGTSGRREVSCHPLLTVISAPARGLWTLTLSPFLIDQVFRRQLIKPPADYFEARGLRRRIWSIALAFCGKRRDSWRMPMLELWRRSGSVDVARKFSFAVQKLAAEGAVPGFKLSIERELGRRFFLIARDLDLPEPTSLARVDLHLDLQPEPEPAPSAIYLNLDEES